MRRTGVRSAAGTKFLLFMLLMAVASTAFFTVRAHGAQAGPYAAQVAGETGSSLELPGRIIIEDEEDEGQDQVEVTSIQAVQVEGSNLVQTASFGSVQTTATDLSSFFGAGRLTMYANHETDAQSLSVIIETGEGGLIVVDGGWRENAAFLVNEIMQKGGHVQAWLLTHPDTDHVGALADILYYYSSAITIDGIYYSFLSDEWYAEKDENVASMVTYLKGAFAYMPAESLHGDIIAGQVIEAGPAKIQVLNSAYAASSDFVNNSSVAYLVSLNGTNVVFLGDLALKGGEALMETMDLSSLGCDFVQMAHHGQSGVDYAFYKELRPKYCLWPTPQWLWDNDNGGGEGSGNWTTLETKNWMVRLGITMHYCVKDGDQVIE